MTWIQTVSSREDRYSTAFGGIQRLPPDLRVVPARRIVDVEVTFYLYVSCFISEAHHTIVDSKWGRRVEDQNLPCCNPDND